MTEPSSAASSSSVDPAEVARFSKLSETWWDPNGKMKPLHRINPLRLAYIRDAACRKFERNPKSLNCLSGLRILDIGCGAGLLCEPLARLGAQVVGIDPSETNISVAKLHAERGHLSVDYRCTTVEQIDLRERFDLPESLSGELLDRVLGLLLDRLLARPERQGRTLRTVVLEAALVEGGTWRTRIVLREATADRTRLQLALAPHLAQLSAPAQSLGIHAETFGGPPSQAIPLLEDDEARRRARLREGLRQVSAGSGEEALLRVVEVDPASRLPERRMALAPREP